MKDAAQPANVRRVPFLDFGRQWQSIRGEVLDEIEQVCDSQRFILGPAVEQFEAAASGFCGGAAAVGCASGTDALWLAMAALGIGPGDAVITTPFSFFATVSSILRAGARPVLADIDPETFNLSPVCTVETIETSDIGDFKAILPVHLYGQPADMTSFSEIARSLGLLVVEDAAQAFAAAWRGVPAGALGHAAAFSFYPTKNLSAFGDAGLATFAGADAAERARALRAHGMRRRYYHDEVGWNSRLDSIQAAVLNVKLRHIAEWNERRAQVAALYDKLLEAAGITASTEAVLNGEPGVALPVTVPEAKHVWHQYVVRIGAGRRDTIRAGMEAAGVATEVYYPVPLHLQTALAFLGHKPGDFPQSELAAEQVLALPIYPEITDAEQERVVEALLEALR